MDHVSKFEIPVDDLARAERFYSALFQWVITSEQRIITAPSDNRGIPIIFGAINGSFKERRDFDHPLILVKVDSIEETLRMAETIGGRTITPLHQRGEDGFFATIADSEGNIVGLWESLKVVD